MVLQYVIISALDWNLERAHIICIPREYCIAIPQIDRYKITRPSYFLYVDIIQFFVSKETIISYVILLWMSLNPMHDIVSERANRSNIVVAQTVS